MLVDSSCKNKLQLKETETIDSINNSKDGVKANMQNMKTQSGNQFD